VWEGQYFLILTCHFSWQGQCYIGGLGASLGETFGGLGLSYVFPKVTSIVVIVIVVVVIVLRTSTW